MYSCQIYRSRFGTGRPQSALCDGMANTPASAMPTESDIVTTAKAKFCRAFGTSLDIRQNVLTQALPPSKPSQKTMANSSQMDGEKKKITSNRKKTTLTNCSTAIIQILLKEITLTDERDMNTPIWQSTCSQRY